VSSVLVALAAGVVPLVTNGAADSGHPAVVAIVDSAGKTTCSGTVIDPHVVLTAAHCVEPDVAHGAYVVFGTSVSASAPSAPIVALRPDPAFDPATLADDAALLVLGTAAQVAPAALGSAAPMVGATVTIVGWGETAADAGDWGSKRSGTARVTGMSAAAFQVAPAPSQPCDGDSGGAALVTSGGSDALVGITSHGDAQCVAGASYTRVDAVASTFVSPTLAALGPGTAAVGSRCLYPEQCVGGAAACVAAPDQPGLGYCTRGCSTNGDCPQRMSCVLTEGGAECRYSVPTPGAFGGACATDTDCFDGLCVNGACTVRCVPTANTCPSSASCANQDGGIDFYCVPAPTQGTGGGSCSLSDRDRSGGALFLVGASALVAVLRGRRRAGTMRR
jgi:hypothetical protein